VRLGWFLISLISHIRQKEEGWHQLALASLIAPRRGITLSDGAWAVRWLEGDLNA